MWHLTCQMRNLDAVDTCGDYSSGEASKPGGNGLCLGTLLQEAEI
jgi:hypothetical protein